jgi:hypothetical protein
VDVTTNFNDGPNISLEIGLHLGKEWNEGLCILNIVA